MPMSNNGLSKITEELGELLQVVGKTMAVGNEVDAVHWSGNLREMMTQEMGDVLTAIGFVTDKFDLNMDAIQRRASEKYELFHQWDAEPPEGATMPTGNSAAQQELQT